MTAVSKALGSVLDCKELLTISVSCGNKLLSTDSINLVGKTWRQQVDKLRLETVFSSVLSLMV